MQLTWYLVLLVLLAGLALISLRRHESWVHGLHEQTLDEQVLAHDEFARSLRNGNGNTAAPAVSELARAALHGSDDTDARLTRLAGMLSRWPINDPNVPTDYVDGAVPRLDFGTVQGRRKAQRLREMEEPFVLVNVNDVSRASTIWTKDYLIRRFGARPHQVEASTNGNEFTYFSKRAAEHDAPSQWHPPQDDARLTFAQWWQIAARANATVNGAGARSRQYYWQMSAGEQRERHSWVTRDLRIFSAEGDGYAPHGFRFVLDPASNKGTHCRFGSKGVWATAHYDGKRNFVAMVRGSKRYILAPPSQCARLSLWPRGHPSARHSSIDWRDHAKWGADAAFREALGMQTVLRAGEVLYIPSYWFHAPVHLETAIQCNTRSGNARKGIEALAKCGFKHRAPSSN